MVGVKIIVAAVAGALVLTVGAGVLIHAQRADAARAEACTQVHSTANATADQRRTLATESGPVTAIVGDSYAAGQWLQDPADGFAFDLARDDSGRFIIDGSGGSGFTNPGPCGGQTFDERLTHLEGESVDTLVLQGGLNDLTASDERDVAAATIARAKHVAGHVVIVGAFTPPAVDAEAVERTNGALKAAADAADVPFIDPSGWDFPVLSDRTHPTKRGHAIIAERLQAALQDGVRQR